MKVRWMPPACAGTASPGGPPNADARGEWANDRLLLMVHAASSDVVVSQHTYQIVVDRTQICSCRFATGRQSVDHRFTFPRIRTDVVDHHQRIQRRNITIAVRIIVVRFTAHTLRSIDLVDNRQCISTVTMPSRLTSSGSRVPVP